MYRIMLRYPLLIDGEFRNMFEREKWRISEEHGYISFGNTPTDKHGWPQNDTVRVFPHNLLGWNDIPDKE